MRMPGFTAELSLCETRGHYHAAATHVPVGLVLQPADLGCYERCYNNCIEQGGWGWEECHPICVMSCRRRRLAM
jgi:hypothetical protein